MIEWLMSIICYATLYGGAVLGCYWLYRDFKDGDYYG